MSFGREYLEESKPTSFCSVCGAKILPKTIFCFECGPPDLPKKEPEETGISLEQAVIRIGVLVFLFVCVVLVKYDTFTDYWFFLQIKIVRFNRRSMEKRFKMMDSS